MFKIWHPFQNYDIQEASNDDFIGLKLLQARINVRYAVESVREHAAVYDILIPNDAMWHDLQVCISLIFKWIKETHICSPKQLPINNYVFRRVIHHYCDLSEVN